MKFRHMYFFDPKKVDLDKLRADAHRLTTVRDRFNPELPEVTIHHHDREDSCVGKTHEVFKPKEV